MPTGVYLLIGIVVGLAAGFLLGLLRRGPNLVQPLADTERRLSETVLRSSAETAERVEKLRSELKLEITEKLQTGFTAVRDALDKQTSEAREEQSRRLTQTADSLEKKFQELRTAVELRLVQLSEKHDVAAREARTELTNALAKLNETHQRTQEALRIAVEQKLTQIQADNANHLETIRKTVDEKLQGTLEKRLGESFKLVSDRLELVHRGLGEMQTLASGVGDLKKVLTNVKARGTWGEMQLGNLLEQVLAPDQFAKNVATRPGSGERVEFAIKLPGREADPENPVWLPIDAKFPKEDYERLIQASDAANAELVETAAAQLENRIRNEARSIRDKYVQSPYTTDFAILYLPVEGLYAEVLRRPGLMDALQRDFRITVAGPTVLCALLNSLQMGFRTLAIQKRSSEVWDVLAAVKTEFGKFGEVITKVQKKLQEASNVIDTAATRTRAIERQLRDVQEMPIAEGRTSPEQSTLLSDEDSHVGK